MIEAIGTMNHSLPLAEARALREKALELAGDDQAIARRLLEMIADTNRTTLASLQASGTASSWDDVASSAHRIAGSARLLARDELTALLIELEAAAHERKPGVAGPLVQQLADALAKLDASIDAALSDFTQH
jgi:HPt (histidine-containing phosphotransfer) domain-containing protein